jgi:hypothetical protein
MTPFVPHPLIANGHAQTVAGILGKHPPIPNRTIHQQLPLPDGDKLLLSMDLPVRDTPHMPVVLLMHGLGGSGSSSYMLRHSRHLTQAGYVVVRFNHRGSGPTHIDRAREIYHSGRTADIDAALHFIGVRWPGRQSMAIGYSMSGNILLRYLGAGTHPGQGVVEGRLPPTHLSKALAICPPIDLETCSRVLVSPSNWHIHRYLIHHITRQARTLEERTRHIPRTRFPVGIDLRTFDSLYTAPRAGFASREEYYAQCSAKPVLSGINIPTTILSSLDDPIVPASIFQDLPRYESVTLRLEPAGGHMGFISRDMTRLGDRRWLDLQVVEWVQGTNYPSVL